MGSHGPTAKGRLHFYHMLDAGAHFHVAFAAPSRLGSDVVHLVNQPWVSWAGAPQHLVVDSATELNGEEFTTFCQRFGINTTTTCPEAHWQNGKIERHGMFLQEMITKVDTEIPVNNYQDLQTTLNLCIQSKNMLSIKHGYAPEIIVFGKQSRLPGSILSDESIPSHMTAIQELEQDAVGGFRKHLQIRECARRAFHVADNSDAIRRAVLRKSCPSRGQFQQGQWVMVWRKQSRDKPSWIGPHQDSNHTVWTTQGVRLFRSAPEHVRRSLPAEGEPEGPELPSDLTHIQNQIDRMNQLPTIDEHVPLENFEEPIESPAHMPEPAMARERLGSTAESLAQPDQEPEINSHQPSINSQESGSDSDQTTVQLLCIDVDDEVYFSIEHPGFAFRCEFNVPAHAVPKDANAESDQVAWTMLSSGSAKQRTEVKMSELTPQEKTLFEQAKQKEIDNWIQTNTITKVLKNQIPPEQVMRSRWILTWKPLVTR
jgi:hypothetical protein